MSLYRTLNETAEEQLCFEESEAGLIGLTLVCGLAVISMQIGFFLIEVAASRKTNSVSILMKNLLDMSTSITGYYLLGHGLMFGASWYGVLGIFDSLDPYEIYGGNWFYFMTFAATSGTIASGCCIERMHLHVYIGLSILLSSFVFPIAGHWAWHPDGFLFQMGFVDMAGAAVVHALGGASAMVCTIMLGPRTGFFNRSLPKELECVRSTLEMSKEAFQVDPINGVLGAMLLFISWLGFNCGAGIGFKTPASSSTIVMDVGHIAFATALGGATGLQCGLFRSVFTKKIVDPTDCQLGLLLGLVSVTGGAHLYRGSSCIVIAALAVILGHYSNTLLVQVQIDDPVNVISVHLVGGALGTLVPAIFGSARQCRDDQAIGLFFTGSVHHLGVQVLGLLLITSFAAIVTFLYLQFICRVLKKPIRVNALQEMVGIDIELHGVDVYKRMDSMQKLHDGLKSMKTTREPGNTCSSSSKPWDTTIPMSPVSNRKVAPYPSTNSLSLQSKGLSAARSTSRVSQHQESPCGSVVNGSHYFDTQTITGLPMYSKPN